jgi:hypothetical protein
MTIDVLCAPKNQLVRIGQDQERADDAIRVIDSLLGRSSTLSYLDSGQSTSLIPANAS